MLDKTFCSQCGWPFGPGDHHYAHCWDHEGVKSIGNPVARVEVRDTGLSPDAGVTDWAQHDGWLRRDYERNFKIVLEALSEGMDNRVLVLTDSSSHAAEIHCMLEDEIPDYNADYEDASELVGTQFKKINPPALVHGLMDEPTLWDALTAARTSDITVATACALDEAMDVFEWPLIILASPTGHGGWIEAAGLAEPPNETTQIIDFVDDHELSELGLNSRLKAYENARLRVHFREITRRR